MDQDPTTPPPSPGAKPGIFNNVNATIAGVTGLVVAVGGLAATWDKFFPSRAATEQPAAAAVPAAAPAAQPVANAAAVTTADDPEAGDPLLYKGELVDGGKTLTIEWDGESWIVTEGDKDPWSYDETLSPDDSRVLATSGGTYLRWPIAGGEVDESDDKVKWKTYARVEVAEPN